MGLNPLSHSGYLRYEGWWLFMPYHHCTSHSPHKQLGLQSSEPHRTQTQLRLQLLLCAAQRPHPPDRLIEANQLCVEQRDPANLLLLPSANPSAAVSIWEAFFPDQNEQSICQHYQCVDISLAGLCLLCLKPKWDKIPNYLIVLAWSSLMRTCWKWPESLGFADIQAQEESLLQELF